MKFGVILAMVPVMIGMGVWTYFEYKIHDDCVPECKENYICRVTDDTGTELGCFCELGFKEQD